MGQNQNAACPRCVNEAHRGDGLAGAGRVLEPEALVGVGIVESFRVDVLVGAFRGFDQVDLNLDLFDYLVALIVLVLFVLLVERRELGSELLVVSGNHFDRRVVNVEYGLGNLKIVNLHPRCQQRRQRSREGVDLMRVEDSAIGEVRLLFTEHALQAKQQRPRTAPLR